MLEIKNLTKRYGNFFALRDLNLKVEEGELFGFVGANGAGKTTTMRICVGLLGADSGEVFIDGKRMLSDHKRLSNKVGYVPDFFGVYPALTSMEYMQFFAASYGMIGADADTLCMDLLRLVKLDHKAEADVNGLSRGMKQRLCLARALVHNPDILFLDEPASGLDPRARFELKEILKNLSSMGKTIIISSHILPELSEMCTSIGIIDRGQMMLKGSIDDIHRAAAMQSPIIITVADHDIDHAFNVLQENPNVQHLTARANVIEVVFTGNKQEEAALLSSLVAANVTLLSFTRQEGSLEALFMQIVSRSRGPAGGPQGARPPYPNRQPQPAFGGHPLPPQGMGMPYGGMPRQPYGGAPNMGGAPYGAMPGMNGRPPMGGAGGMNGANYSYGPYQGGNVR